MKILFWIILILVVISIIYFIQKNKIKKEILNNSQEQNLRQKNQTNWVIVQPTRRIFTQDNNTENNSPVSINSK